MAQVAISSLMGRPSPWPASYHGHGIRIERAPDGTYVGIVEGGYRSAPYTDAGEALADIAAWIERQEAGVHAV
jgi:hypothetical protein